MNFQVLTILVFLICLPTNSSSYDKGMKVRAIYERNMKRLFKKNLFILNSDYKKMILKNRNFIRFYCFFFEKFNFKKQELNNKFIWNAGRFYF